MNKMTERQVEVMIIIVDHNRVGIRQRSATWSLGRECIVGVMQEQGVSGCLGSSTARQGVDGHDRWEGLVVY